MIDYTLPLQVKAADPNLMLSNASQYADYFTKMKADGELSRLYKESNGDLDKMLEIGQQSPMARWVMPQLQAQKSANEQAALEKQKAQIDIYNTGAQAQERMASAGNTEQKTADARLSTAKQAIFAGAQNGNPQYIKMGLDSAKAAGALDDQTYAQFIQQLSGLGNDPAKISEWAKNAILSGSQNPASFLFQTADNAANNAQSDINNLRTTQASIYGTDVAANTADKNRAQSAQQFEQNYELNAQKLYFEQNKPIGFETGNDGYRYAIYPGGKGIRVIGEDGQPIKVQPKGQGNLTAQNAQREETQRLQRVDAILPEIEKILPGATSSYIGAGADTLGRVVGYSTEGAKATAQLKTLAGQLVSLMPKMSGPQSDKDVAMYREMAGNLADDTQPIQARMAALQTIKALNDKYKGMSQQNSQSAAPSTFNLFD